MALLSRKYRLVVGAPSITTFESDVFTKQELVGVQDITTAEDFRTEQLNAVEISELQVKATVRSSSGSSAASSSDCIIDIYNLSPDTREVVEKVNNYVIFEAGYASDFDLKLIFSGQVISFETRLEGEDLITTLVCKDGYITNAGIRIGKAYPKGKTFGYVLKDLAAIYEKGGIPTGQLELGVRAKERQNYIQLRSPDETKLPQGYSVFG